MEEIYMQTNKRFILNKSLVTNLLSLLIIIISFFLPLKINKHILNIGLFALSGAITNWLAIFMLFEKIPFLYGSGVIPARFEDFKKGIYELIMNQFFTSENIKKFFVENEKNKFDKNLKTDELMSDIDIDKAFDSLVKIILESPFGNMLGMFGGKDALTPLKEPFINEMRQTIIEIVSENKFKQNLMTKIFGKNSEEELIDKITIIVKKRLDELTPQKVKEIIQKMIRKHLGWLVVWGGVFGGLIGLVASFIS
jgi:uncharacterized membrane protein YheB (UPF0754 family)